MRNLLTSSDHATHLDCIYVHQFRSHTVGFIHMGAHSHQAMAVMLSKPGASTERISLHSREHIGLTLVDGRWAMSSSCSSSRHRHLLGLKSTAATAAAVSAGPRIIDRRGDGLVVVLYDFLACGCTTLSFNPFCLVNEIDVPSYEYCIPLIRSPSCHVIFFQII